MYPALLKRMDDSNDSVRMSACGALAAFFCPRVCAGGHAALRGTPFEYSADTMLVHLDDSNERVQVRASATLFVAVKSKRFHLSLPLVPCFIHLFICSLNCMIVWLRRFVPPFALPFLTVSAPPFRSIHPILTSLGDPIDRLVWQRAALSVLRSLVGNASAVAAEQEEEETGEAGLVSAAAKSRAMLVRKTEAERARHRSPDLCDALLAELKAAE